MEGVAEQGRSLAQLILADNGAEDTDCFADLDPFKGCRTSPKETEIVLNIPDMIGATGVLGVHLTNKLKTFDLQRGGARSPSIYRLLYDQAALERC